MGYAAMSVLNAIYAIDEFDEMTGYISKNKTDQGKTIITTDAQAPYGPIQCIFELGPAGGPAGGSICNMRIRMAFLNMNYFSKKCHFISF